ncbi:MAG: cupin domain-containing protein [Pseudomonadota bacterium]
MMLYDQLPPAGKEAIEHSRNNETLLEHHIEGGSFKEIFRNTDYTIIQFHLNVSEVSSLHRLKNTEEQWLSFESPLIIAQIDKDHQYTEEKLMNSNSITIKSGNPGNWFGAYTIAEPATVYCICRPVFDFANFELLKDESVIEKICSKNPDFIDSIRKLTIRDTEKKISVKETLESNFFKKPSPATELENPGTTNLFTKN